MVAAKRQHNPSSECPICRHKFPTGITGWYSHIGKLSNHPNWHPEVRDPGARKELFIQEFPEFFRNAWTPSRRQPSPSVARDGAITVHTPGPPPVAAMMQPRFCPCCGQTWPVGLKPPV